MGRHQRIPIAHDLSLPKMLSGANTFEISDHQFKPG